MPSVPQVEWAMPADEEEQKQFVCSIEPTAAQEAEYAVPVVIFYALCSLFKIIYCILYVYIYIYAHSL